jgi:hypothetical protein
MSGKLWDKNGWVTVEVTQQDIDQFDGARQLALHDRDGDCRGASRCTAYLY